jgi:hypothetical protein
MRTEPRNAGGVNRPRGETITRVPTQEFELSTTLNRLIGEANCEAALLPTRKTISDWTSAEVCEAVITYQQAIIAALRCAIELQTLEDLDAYSRLWISETRELYDIGQDQVEFLATATAEERAIGS